MFCVPKAGKDKNCRPYRFLFKITGYNYVISDEDDTVKLPQFLNIINFLRGCAWASILDLANVFRQWQITMNSYCDFAYFVGGYVWVDTSLVFFAAERRTVGMTNCPFFTPFFLKIFKI